LEERKDDSIGLTPVKRFGQFSPKKWIPNVKAGGMAKEEAKEKANVVKAESIPKRMFFWRSSSLHILLFSKLS